MSLSHEIRVLVVVGMPMLLSAVLWGADTANPEDAYRNTPSLAYVFEAEAAGEDAAAAQPPATPPAAQPPATGLQPQAAETAPPPRMPAREELASAGPRRAMYRLASVPNMFGDFFYSGIQVEANDGYHDALADFPTAGGAGRARIAENNKALPMDRCYFTYNHFHNALQADPDQFVSGLGRDFSVDRYTLGLEKTFLEGRWSVEARMPLVSPYRLTTPEFGVAGGEIGNLGIIVKRLLLATECATVAAGLGIETPTGSDVAGRFYATRFFLRNDAVYLSPYVGFLAAPNECLFFQGFLQVDVPTSGNRVDLPNYPGLSSRLNDQTLLFVDLSLGRWLYRNPCACGLTGLATVLEFHYASTLQDADTVVTRPFTFGNVRNRLDVSDLTVGLHAELGKTVVRVGGAFPLDDGENRAFDSEFLVQIERRF